MMRTGSCVEMAVKLAIGAALAAALVLAQTSHPGTHNVTAVKHWNAAGATRIAIEVSGEFEYRGDHLHNPERVYFDILNARPKFDGKRLFAEDLDDALVKRIRVAETSPGVTRVVFDLTDNADVKASVLTGPNRLLVEVRGSAHPSTPSQAVSSATAPAAPPPPPVGAPVAMPEIHIAPPAKIGPSDLPAPILPTAMTDTPRREPAVSRAATVAPLSTTAATTPPATTPAVTSAPASTPPSTPTAVIPKAARHTATGDTSLVRALGLKLQRIVIDPGHGGHDEGTQGPKGLLEKDLVLDVSLRLGKLIEDKMGAEVIYTRSDDTFIPLEGRTALANEKKADLFLSIHANSSPAAPRITGVETYYLNFTDSKDAMEVASRENAGSQQSIFDLRDLIQKISLHDKASESRDFAERVQTALFAFSSKTFPNERNRGVKKAPFVVLIGANMPSVLAEIGFISNAREEALLKKPEYRQKLAEALYRGVSKYADSLSHFQVAAN
jgi:N-acetylmuramoyl-L-alanine amidase